MEFFNYLFTLLSPEKIAGAAWGLLIGLAAFTYREARERRKNKELMYDMNLDLASKSMDILVQTETNLTKLILDLENGEDQSEPIISLIAMLNPMAISANEDFQYVERIYKDLYNREDTGKLRELKKTRKVLNHLLRVHEMSYALLMARQSEIIAVLTTRSEALSEQKILKRENAKLSETIKELTEHKEDLEDAVLKHDLESGKSHTG